MEFTNVAEFLLYVIPGFVSIEFYRWRFPGKTRADFYTLTWSIIFGVLITAILVWVDTHLTHGLLGYRVGAFPSVTFILILIAAGLFVGFSRMLWRSGRFSLAKRFSGINRLTPDVNSVWARVNQPGTEQWARVFLDNETQYIGYIRYFRNDPDEQDQDFLLADAHRVDSNLRVKYRGDGAGVYLNTRNVRSIEFYDGRSPRRKRTLRSRKRTARLP